MSIIYNNYYIGKVNNLGKFTLDEIKDGMLIQVKNLLRKLEKEPYICGVFFGWNDDTLFEDLFYKKSVKEKLYC